MSFGLRLRYARLVRSRILFSSRTFHSKDGVGKCLFHSSRRRNFSDHKKQESQALFRALDLENDKGDQNTEDSRTKKENFTLDDFFSNMNESKGRTKNKSRKDSQFAKRIGSKARYNRRKDYAEKNDDLSSFFDEVNSMMKKNKLRSELADDEKVKKSENNTTGSRVSIFDIMQPTSKPRSSNAYDQESFEEYIEMVERITSTPKFLRRHTRSPVDDERAKSIFEWIQSEEPVVSCNLPTLDKAMNGEISEGENGSQLVKQFREELEVQKQKLMAFYGWDQQQYTVAIAAITNLGGLCAKYASGAPLEIAWQKLKEAGYKMEKEALHNYLYVSSTFTNRSIQISTTGGSLLDFLNTDNKSDSQDSQEEHTDKEDNDIEKVNSVDVASEVALVHDFLFDPSEQSTSIRVRMLVSQGRAKEAERLLENNAENDDLRLRTYAPVYKAYLDDGDVSSAFHLFVKMKEGKYVILQPETYVQLIACIAENGYFSEESDPIDGVRELGYSVGSGPLLFDLLASELAENSVEISGASAKRLYNAFQHGFKNKSNIRALHLLESIQTCNEPAKSDELVVNRVTLDETNGLCPRTGTQLRLIGLDKPQKKQLQDGLIHLAMTSYEERTQKKNKKAELDLRNFGEWLDTRSGAPFTAIVDGPNVAYYMQNFQDGIFNYHQIKFVVDALEDMGEKVLVIMPQKYTQDSFIIATSSGKKRQRLSKSEKKICRDLVSSGKTYTVPSGCLDDYYWMYASVSSQSNSMNGQDIYISPGNDDGRWPGIRPMLISNDKMRDHKLSLLEPRLFRRWFSNFIVNFTFSAFVGETCEDKEIGFRTADFYSREIQGNDSTDKTGNKCGTSWHFPVSDWEDNESFCIRMPTK